jgi:hypothetical protein
MLDLSFPAWDAPPPHDLAPAQAPESQPLALSEADSLPAYDPASLDAYLDDPELAPDAVDEIPLPEPAPDLPSAEPWAAEPEFVRKAKSRERSRRTVRILLLLGSLLLLAVLTLQGIYVFRERLVARVPFVAPLVTEVCRVFECETPVAANIDALSLESTELQNLPGRTDAFVLEITLRNRSAEPQAWPSLELTLNDESGQAAVRRVLSPVEYLRDTPASAVVDQGLDAHSDQSLKLIFALDKAKAAGYRVYLFYP